jgi:hypothetical protein
MKKSYVRRAFHLMREILVLRFNSVCVTITYKLLRKNKKKFISFASGVYYVSDNTVWEVIREEKTIRHELFNCKTFLVR